MTALIQLEAVELSYQRGEEVVHAVNGISMSVSAGEVVALAGPSGSGKTSLVAVICGWETPTGGQVEWAEGLGTKRRRDQALWSSLAVVPQTLGLMPELTLAENVALPLRLAGAATGREVEALLDQLGLEGLADRFPHQVSLGQQQRAAVARALIARPAVIVADEPSAHLDQAATELVLGAVRARTAEGGACILATHDPALLAAADRVVDLAGGTAPGPPA